MSEEVLVADCASDKATDANGEPEKMMVKATVRATLISCKSWYSDCQSVFKGCLSQIISGCNFLDFCEIKLHLELLFCLFHFGACKTTPKFLKVERYRVISL